MNTIKPICNVCGSEKNATEPGWVRCFGVFDDSPTASMQAAPPVFPNNQPRVNMAAPVNLDICPACVPGIPSVGQLKAITASLKGAPPVVNIDQAKQILDSLKAPKTAVAATAEAAPAPVAPDAAPEKAAITV